MTQANPTFLTPWSSILMSWNITNPPTYNTVSLSMSLWYYCLNWLRSVPIGQFHDDSCNLLPQNCTDACWEKGLSCSHSWGKRAESVNKREVLMRQVATVSCAEVVRYVITCTSLSCWPSSRSCIFLYLIHCILLS